MKVQYDMLFTHKYFRQVSFIPPGVTMGAPIMIYEAHNQISLTVLLKQLLFSLLFAVKNLCPGSSITTSL